MNGSGMITDEEHMTCSDGPDPVPVDSRFELLDALGTMVFLTPGTDTVEMHDQISLLQEIAAAVSAAQARVMVAYDTARRTEQAAAGVPKSRIGHGIAEEIGLARRISPNAAAVQLGHAKAWHTRLPESFEQLRLGRASAPQLTLLAVKTSHLDQDTARRVDAHLAPHLAGWNTTQTEHAVLTAAYQADPRAFVHRRAQAEKDRRVWCRPAPTPWPCTPPWSPSPRASPPTPPSAPPPNPSEPPVTPGR